MDTKKIDTVLTIIAFVIGVTGIILGIVIGITPEAEHGDPGFQSLVTGTIQFTNVLLIIGAAAAILFGLYYFATDIKKNIPLLVGVVVFVIIAIICYSVASDEVLPTYGEDITSATSRLSGAGLGVMYVLVVVAVVAALAGEIVRIFK